MNTTVQTTKSPHLLIWIAGIAVTLFCALGIAAIMGWVPTSMGKADVVTEAAKPANAARNSGSSPAAKTPARAAPPAAPAVVATQAPAAAKCIDCGVIESTREITTKGEGSGVGAVGGAVVGGLIGNQVGSGRGNTAATAIGAVGGAVAGHVIEKQVKSTKSQEFTVRLEDGSSRVFNDAGASAWRTGDRVKIVGGAIQANH